MWRPICLLLVFAVRGTPAGTARANFLYITVTAKKAVEVHAIWRPYAGAIGDGDAQQNAVLNNRRFANVQDSTRRWRDTTVRDTIETHTPVGFTVDMNDGPIVIEALGDDSVRIEAQLTPARGATVGSWGHAFVVSADGVTPRVDRRR
jgi:hypothetical protein